MYQKDRKGEQVLKTGGTGFENTHNWSELWKRISLSRHEESRRLQDKEKPSPETIGRFRRRVSASVVDTYERTVEK